jgi:hypothetical protein
MPIWMHFISIKMSKLRFKFQNLTHMDQLTTHDFNEIDRSAEEKGLKGTITRQSRISHIDLRKVNCACRKPDCRIGLNFDTDADNNRAIMRLTNKYGEETTMYLDRQTIDCIIEHLRELKKSIKNLKKSQK